MPLVAEITEALPPVMPDVAKAPWHETRVMMLGVAEVIGCVLIAILLAPKLDAALMVTLGVTGFCTRYNTGA